MYTLKSIKKQISTHKKKIFFFTQNIGLKHNKLTFPLLYLKKNPVHHSIFQNQIFVNYPIKSKIYPIPE